MAKNRWDAEEYAYQMEAVGELGDAARAYVTEMNKYLSVELTRHGRNYDPSGAIADSVGRFAAATARLQNLHESMKQYEQEYSAMLENAQGTVENVAVENTVYGTFGALVVGGTAMASVYAGSAAYQFCQSGFDFNTDFNDFAAFQENTNYQFFESMWGLSEIGSWNSHTADLIYSAVSGTSTTDFSEALQLNALTAALDGVPGYKIEDKVDWGWLGEKLGVPGLGKNVEKILKWTSSLEGAIDYNALSEKLTDLMMGSPMSDVIEVWSGFMEADKLGEFMSKLSKMGFSTGKAVETLLNMYYHITANHITQVEYLDSLDKAMAMAGYSDGSGLRGTLQEIREELVDQEKYFLNQFSKEAEKILKDKLGDAVTDSVNTIGQVILSAIEDELPTCSSVAADLTPLKYADLILDGVSLSVDLAGEDQIKAIETLKGLQTYTPTLISSFEKNMEMINAGVASAEDVANTENLFQLIRSAKIQEYEAMLTLQSQGDLAVELGQKLALLERMESLENFATIPDSHLPNGKQ